MKLIEISALFEGCSFGIETESRSVFVVSHQNQVSVYENRCPHLGVTLEFMPDQFLTHDKSLIQCSSHGALFEHHSGECISGPCTGQKLTAVPYTISDGWICI